MITSINEYKKHLEEQFDNDYITLSDVDILPLSIIDAVLEFHYDDSGRDKLYSEIKSLDQQILDLLKQQTLKYITNGPFKFDNVLYRGIKLDETIKLEDLRNDKVSYLLKPIGKLDSWTMDLYTAEQFADSDYDHSIVLKMPLSELDILFALDVFFSCISKHQYKKLSKHQQGALKQYVSEQEILCESKTYALNKNNFDLLEK